MNAFVNSSWTTLGWQPLGSFALISCTSFDERRRLFNKNFHTSANVFIVCKLLSSLQIDMDFLEPEVVSFWRFPQSRMIRTRCLSLQMKTTRTTHSCLYLRRTARCPWQAHPRRNSLSPAINAASLTVQSTISPAILTTHPESFVQFVAGTSTRYQTFRLTRMCRISRNCVKFVARNSKRDATLWSTRRRCMGVGVTSSSAILRGASRASLRKRSSRCTWITILGPRHSSVKTAPNPLRISTSVIATSYLAPRISPSSAHGRGATRFSPQRMVSDNTRLPSTKDLSSIVHVVRGTRTAPAFVDTRKRV